MAATAWTAAAATAACARAFLAADYADDFGGADFGVAGDLTRVSAGYGAETGAGAGIGVGSGNAVDMASIWPFRKKKCNLN